MKPYLFTYSQAYAQSQVHAVLNDTAGVETWVAPFPYAAILVSKLSAKDLGAILRGRLPGAWLLVSEVNAHTVDGWLPGDLWEYVNNPTQAWTKNVFARLPVPEPPPEQSGLSSESGAGGLLYRAAGAAGRDSPSRSGSGGLLSQARREAGR